MSKLARALALAALLVAMSLAAMTAAQAQATDHPAGRDARRSRAERQFTSQQQAARDASLRQRLAEQRSSIPTGASVQLPSPMRPAEPSGEAGFTPSLGVLAAVLALVVGIAVLVVRRASRRQHLGQMP
jgi:hypothetical protein